MEAETKINLLQAHNAYYNCIKSGNTEWEQKHLENIEQTLLDVLPHGSGIDCKWDIHVQEKYIACHNSYHCMNDNGMYCGYIDFTVLIKADRRDIFGKLDFAINGRFSKNQDLRDYLQETISAALENL